MTTIIKLALVNVPQASRVPAMLNYVGVKALTMVLCGCFAGTLFAAEIQHNFSSAAFSGTGYSSHVLTIKQLEDQAKDKNIQARAAAEAKAIAAAANTPQAQFISNLQSRIYAQLSKQITDTLFGATGQPACQGTECNGQVSIGGNTVNWNLSADGRNISVKIVNDTNPAQYTSMTVPVGTFAF